MIQKVAEALGKLPPLRQNMSKTVPSRTTATFSCYRNGLGVINSLSTTLRLTKGGRGFERNLRYVPCMLAQLAGPKTVDE